MSLSFKDRVVIVTGAGRGIGRSHALDFARRGAKVVVNDPGLSQEGLSESASPADEVVAEIIASGGVATADYGDISIPEDVQGLVDGTLAKFGQIDVLVNNAGTVRRRSLAETEPQDLIAQIETHVLGSLLLAQAVWPHMIKANYGRIVLTSSQVGMYGQTNLAAYGAAKGGVLGLLQGLKLEAADTPIKVNCVAPFGITRATPPTFLTSRPGWVSSDQVTPAVVYLSHESCETQGQVVVAGGGHFAIARMVESRGIDFDRLEDVTAEGIAERVAELTDFDSYWIPESAMGAIQPTFDRILALPEER